MENQVNHSDLILSVLDFIIRENTVVMDEVKHLQKLKDLGLPNPDDFDVRLASMQSKMEMSAAIMNILSPAMGGIKIVLPAKFDLLNPENPNNETE